MQSKRFMGTRLAPGVKPSHLGTFYLGAFLTICFAVAINALQPYLLSTFLGLPPSRQGEATGTIALINEIVILAAVGTWGVLSDRHGRRSVFALGFAVMAIGFALTPLSDSLSSLLGFRAVFAIGIAATTAMLATVVADYVVDEDRGKANAITGVANGLGATAGALALARLPTWFTSSGQDGISAGTSSYLFAAVVCAVGAIAMWMGLRPRGGQEQASEHQPLLKIAKEGAMAVKDPGIALSYLAAFVARADLAVAGVFFPLWMTRHYQSLLPAGAATAELDAATATGVAAGGALIGIVGGAGLLFAPVIGILCDRINRVHALAFSLAINTIGYGMMGFVTDPTGGYIKIAAIVVGFGQVAGVISSQVLVQQLAPAKYRGSIIGTFGVCGALGIMLTSTAGGVLFDRWMDAGPFVLLSVLNGLVAVASLVMVRHISTAKSQQLVVA